MYEKFEVQWESVLPGTPEQVWDAFTRRSAGWIWEISYEPRVGGAERGLTGDGTVTVWEPNRHFQTVAERPDGWRNALEYKLEPHPDGTLVRYRHNATTNDYANEYDACVRHTAFYRHSLAEYVRHFAGRDAAYVSIDEAPGSFADVCRRLGVSDEAAVGDRVRTGPAQLEATIDYLEPPFLGLRTDDAFIRVYGREAWGGPVSVALHLFDPAADAETARQEWSAFLGANIETKAVA